MMSDYMNVFIYRIRNRRKKIWYDEDGNGSYYKRMQAYVQRNLKNTQNLDDRITKSNEIRSFVYGFVG